MLIIHQNFELISKMNENNLDKIIKLQKYIFQNTIKKNVLPIVFNTSAQIV